MAVNLAYLWAIPAAVIAVELVTYMRRRWLVWHLLVGLVIFVALINLMMLTLRLDTSLPELLLRNDLLVSGGGAAVIWLVLKCRRNLASLIQKP